MNLSHVPFGMLAAFTSELAQPLRVIDQVAVQFRAGGEVIKATIYRPRDIAAQAKYPAVVVTGAWFTIQEQMPATYAMQLAQQGYVALTFDFRGFGKSEGKARYAENPQRKAEDIKAAANFLAGYPNVDPSRLSGLALCASTGYMANAIIAGAPIKAMACVAPWIQDQDVVYATYGGPERVQALIQVGESARKTFANTGTVLSVPAAGPSGSDAVMQGVPYYTELNRGMIPAWENKFALMSWADWLRFDSLAPASELRVPVLVVHSDQAALPEQARRFHSRIRGIKEIFWSTESHMEFYDRSDTVSRSAGLAADFYRRSLRERSRAEDVEQVLKQLAAEVDAKAWDSVEQRMTTELDVNYESLGGLKGKVLAKDLVNGWRTFHAKYTTMRHQYYNFNTSIYQDDAVARFDGMATLAHESKRWTVGGRYAASLKYGDGRWRVTALTFVKDFAHGDQ
jgi:hypothetical protein